MKIKKALRLLGYTTPNARQDKKVLYTTASIKRALVDLVKFNNQMRSLINDDEQDGNALVSEVLKTNGLEYDHFPRDIVSPSKGRIQQKIIFPFPEVNTLETKAKKTSAEPRSGRARTLVSHIHLVTVLL
mmetsp:Transcript_3598/g.4519  ORF Transcript_3598/g.4519 Transcript_3598/m.4519 type:complete len:130 (-) Transcript_3598:30-419(-)